MAHEQSWDSRRRGREDYDGRRAFELQNFGTTSLLSPRSARLAKGPPNPAAPRNTSPSREASMSRPSPTGVAAPTPGGSARNNVPTRSGTYRTRNDGDKRQTSKTSDISLPQAAPQMLPGHSRQAVDTTIEFSKKGGRGIRVMEGRNVPLPKRVRLSRSGDANDWEGAGDCAPPEPGAGSDSEDSLAGQESEAEEDWRDVEEGSNPAAVIDETGEVRESKRKTYMSSVRRSTLFHPRTANQYHF